MIQDIYPHVLNNQYKTDAVIGPNDNVIVYDNGKVLIKNEDKTIVFPKMSEFKEDAQYTYLFSIDDAKYFTVKNYDELPDDYSFMDIREIRNMKLQPKHAIFAALTAKHILDWYRDTQYCGRCGNKMVHSETERAMTCTKCGYTAYPRIMPAVIVGVRNGDKLLMTKYRTGYQHYALVAGFTEIGETVEETVAREVMEEAGLKVNNIRYYKSQPWGLANDILLGYYCDVDGDTTIHMDEGELKFAEWVKREDIELQPDDFSLTNEMMYMFKENFDA